MHNKPRPGREIFKVLGVLALVLALVLVYFYASSYTSEVRFLLLPYQSHHHSNSTIRDTIYAASSTEKYILDHAKELGYQDTQTNPTGCNVYRDPKASNPAVFARMSAYEQDLEKYETAIKQFQPIPDLLKQIVNMQDSDEEALTAAHDDNNSRTKFAH